MFKYYLFLIIASMWFSTVLCVGDQGGSSTGSATEVKKGEEEIKSILQDLSSISTSSNVFIKFMRDRFKKSFQNLEQEKQEFKEEIKEATEIVKKVQKILQALKKSGMPIKTELQSELEEIGKTASTELSKVNTMNIENVIETLVTKFKSIYGELTGKMEKLFKLALKEITTTSKTNEEKEKALSTSRDEVSEFIKMAIKYVLSAHSDQNDIHDKLKKAHDSISKIRNGLIRAEEIDYYLILSYKDNPKPNTEPKKDPKEEPPKDTKADAASSTCSSLTQCVFALMFGMLFYISNPN